MEPSRTSRSRQRTYSSKRHKDPGRYISRRQEFANSALIAMNEGEDYLTSLQKAQAVIALTA